jgi:hypothetical protein
MGDKQQQNRRYQGKTLGGSNLTGGLIGIARGWIAARNGLAVVQTATGVPAIFQQGVIH